MRCSNRTWLTKVGVAILVVEAVLVLSVASRMLALQRFSPAKVDPAMAKAGDDLFHHEWKAGDPLSPEGDGLGPVFNATSCVACHHQGGSGGGGSRDNNVTTFSVRVPGQKPRKGVVHASATRPEFQETLRDVHPQLPASAHPELNQLVAVHQLAAPRGNRVNVRGRDIEMMQALMHDNLIPMPPGVAVSQVNPPALFGAGWIDAVPDRILIAAEKNQRLKLSNATPHDDTPVGRVSRLPDGRIGKFGWKAQTASLAEFVQAACANELGLGNPGQPQPRSLHKPDYEAVGLDLTQIQCDQITAFVGSLEKPTERLPADPTGRADVSTGKKLFGAIGCADCHTPNLGSIEGIYSDLLLHRMDVGMAGGGAYNDRPQPVPDSDPNGSPDPSEWRTPPLWGVADSAPYMHDGRADTLEEAIAVHGGQGKGSATRFSGLRKAEQTQVIAFLKTLRAP